MKKRYVEKCDDGGQDCPGVFVIGQNLQIKIAIDELFQIWYKSEAEEWINSIIEISL